VAAVTFAEDNHTLSEPSRLLGIEVSDDAGDVEGDDGFPPLRTLQELQRLPRILKTIFRERCRALRAVEDEEPGFLVGITVAVVRPELVAL